MDVRLFPSSFLRSISRSRFQKLYAAYVSNLRSLNTKAKYGEFQWNMRKQQTDLTGKVYAHMNLNFVVVVITHKKATLIP